MSERPVEIGPLRGVLHDAGKGPAFACIHGLTLSHDMFAALGALADAEGITMLRFHMRGHHDSGGRLEDQGFNDEVADALSALEFLQSQPGVDPSRVGLLGFSIGGAVAAVTSRKARLKALATWGSLLDTSKWKDERYAQYRAPQGGVVKIWDDIAVSSRLFTEAIACNPFQDALDYAGPTFSAHGGRDRNHPPAKSAELVERRKALGKIAEHFFPADSGHKFQAPEVRQVLVRKTLDFFKKYL